MFIPIGFLLLGAIVILGSYTIRRAEPGHKSWGGLITGFGSGGFCLLLCKCWLWPNFDGTGSAVFVFIGCYGGMILGGLALSGSDHGHELREVEGL